MDEGNVDIVRVVAVIQRDNPQVLERAMMIVRIEDLQLDNERLKAVIAESVSVQTGEPE